MVHLHKKFSDSQIKELFKRYLNNEIKREYVQQILGIKKRRFFVLLKRYKENPDGFSIQFFRFLPS